MIVTVTLNPAVDKTIEIAGFRIDSVNRVASLRLDAGGKGINVSKVIASLGGGSLATGVVGGRAGQMILESLDTLGIQHRFLNIPGETRTNLKVVDPQNHTNTDINEPGLPLTGAQLAELEQMVFEGLQPGDAVVFSGSVPARVSTGLYGRWIAKAKAVRARTLLDADGALLAEGVKAGPFLVKPNLQELERLFDCKITAVKQAGKLAKSLIDDYGIAIVVVSLGKDGALFVSNDRCLRAFSPAVPVRSTVGAGDAVVAALAFGLDTGLDLEETARLAVAAGSASVMMSGTQPPEQAAILELKKQVALEPLSI